MYNFNANDASFKRCVTKFLVCIKLSFIFLIIPNFNVSAAPTEQKITLFKKDATLVEIFSEIRKQIDYDFVYSEKQIAQARKVTIAVKGASIKEALDICFKHQPLVYMIANKTIIIKFKIQSIDNLPIQTNYKVNVKGKIVNQQGKPISNALIKEKETLKSTTSNEEGDFVLTGVEEKSILVISYVGFLTKQIKIETAELGNIVLSDKPTHLNEVEIVSTGYQNIPKERATGSFVQIDNKLLNRSISTNIIDRLDGITSGLIFNKNDRTINSPAISIRGVSTIYANRQPLIIIDNFPFNGDLSSINPNDVESITILKDAAAAAIWGAFSGNGVIVITSKKGRYNQEPNIEINSNLTVGNKPNVYYSPQLTSKEYIAVEQFLFKQGHYNDALTSSTFPIVSPIVTILNNRGKNLISSSDSLSLIEKYKEQDLRSDISKYLYQKSINQQYSLNISGGGKNNVYFFSAGYDKNLENVKRNQSNRITVNASNSIKFLKNKLELTNVIYYTKSSTQTNGLSSPVSNLPYLKLKENDGSSSIFPNLYNPSFVDSVSKGGNYLDWHYKPLEELDLNNNSNSLNEFRINSVLKYNVTQDLNVTLQHQFNQGNLTQKSLYDSNSFYTRNYINQFTQHDQLTDSYARPVPLGGILDRGYLNSSSQNMRLQFNYKHDWNPSNRISALAGMEVRDVNTDFNSNRVYGYNEMGSNNTIDYASTFLLSPSLNTGMINSNISQLGTSNRYISYFSNIGYTFKDRYTFTASARKDESNIFGVKTNQKGVPLWSAGISWDINKESFYDVKWIPYLRLRLTNGYQGNVDNTLSSLVTAIINPGAANPFLQPVSILSNPPNPELRWEKVNTTNLGIDFSLTSRISGSIDFYLKKGTDLIGSSPVDPTTGVQTFKGNSASIAGKGIDVSVNSSNLKGRFTWNTVALFSFTKDKVKKYELLPPSIGSSFYGINPIVGNPLYSVYSFKWAGLDSEGDPQVYFNDRPTKDYGFIYGSRDLTSLKYSGSANPTMFGSIRNNFSWNQLDLSINITYKLGYVFRRPSVNYYNLFGGSPNMPDQDYQNRWQKKGDEYSTNVPSMKYPAVNLRDIIYQNSDILIENGDHIRIQDISLGYNLNNSSIKKLPFKSIRFYMYINNIGILWRSNKYGIDPDYIPFGTAIFPNPTTYAVGVKVNL